jgi:hypothetical protein
MTAPLTAAELCAIEARANVALELDASGPVYLRDDVPRLIATVKALQGQLEALPDPAHRCACCGKNWVDSDAGFDTCAACARSV